MKKLSLFITVIMVVGMLICGVAYADTGANEVASMADVINDFTVVYAAVIVGILGALAFSVELIVQVTKDIPPIGKIPTKLYVLVLSLVVCELVLFIYASWASIAVLWYYIVLAAFMSMVVAYISMYGWDTLKELYGRYVRLKE